MIICNYIYLGHNFTITLEVKDGYGARVDSVDIPQIVKVYNPNLELDTIFPQNMTKLSTGVYYYTLIITNHFNNLGAYLIDIKYDVDSQIKYQLIQLSVKESIGSSGGFTASVQ